MGRLSLAIKDLGFWTRSVAFLLNCGITSVWIFCDDMYMVSRLQEVIFYLTVYGYNTVLGCFTVVFLMEPLGAWSHRLLVSTGACLFTLTGVITSVNLLIFTTLKRAVLSVSILCMLNSCLLTTDLLFLEGCRWQTTRCCSEPPEEDVAVLRDSGIWLRGFAFLVNVAITVLWLMFGELPTVCREQRQIFFHVIPGFNVILLALTTAPFLEPLEAFLHRILGLTGVCLFALAGTIGVINYVALGEFQTSSLFIALLCLLNCLLLIADLIVLEGTCPLERRDPPTPYDTWASNIASFTGKDDDKF